MIKSILNYIILSIFFIFFTVVSAAAITTLPITINHNQVGGSTLTNFTVGWGGQYPFLKTVANGGQVQSSSGYDILFSSVSGCGSGLLNWEQESWSGTTGKVQYWIQIPSISSSSNTTFYMCYGSGSYSSFQGGATGSAWDTNYKGVWHLGAPNAPPVLDSTSNGNNGTAITNPSNQWGTGLITGAAQFQNGQAISVANHVGTLTDFTINAWIKFLQPSSNQASGVIWRAQNGTPLIYFGWGPNSETNSTLSCSTINQVCFFLRSTSIAYSAKSTATINDGNWHMITLIRSTGTTNISLQVDNGAAVNTAISEVTAINLSAVGSFMGGQPSDLHNFALQDETGIWSRALSSAEVTSLYNSGAGLAYASLGGINTSLVAYYKFDDASGTSVADATGNGNTGTWSLLPQSVLPAATVNGIADGAAFYTNIVGGANCNAGVTQASYAPICGAIDVGNASSLQITGAMTIEAWAKLNNFGTNGTDFFSMTQENYAAPYDFYAGGSNNLGELFFYRSGAGQHGAPCQSPNNTSAMLGAWHYYVATDSVSFANLYLDTTNITSPSGNNSCTQPSGATVGWGGGDAMIGGSRANVPTDNRVPKWMDGTEDEVRVSNIARSTGYITAVYNNLSSPSTFFIPGVEGTQFGGPIAFH